MEQQYTPMMQQYLDIKKNHQDCILLYRLGDFYEIFFEDALIASKELEITLTGKNCGQEERAPMCGVPYHAVEGYLNKLISKGFKVAICEQVEDPKLTKGIVKREVVRIVTPGTNLNMLALDEGKNNYLMCVVFTIGEIGISVVDVTTGEYKVTQVDSLKKFMDEFMKFKPTELICNDSFLVSGIDISYIKETLGTTLYALDSYMFEEEYAKNIIMKQFSTTSIQGLGLEDFSTGVLAAGAILNYLYDTQKTSLSQFTEITPYITSKYMLLDSSTRRNLEVTESLREKQKRGSLLGVLDKTKTAMGARKLRSYLEQPLVDKDLINGRLDSISELNMHSMYRDEIREYLQAIYDIERLLSKITYKTANPRDLIAFLHSIEMVPHIKQVLSQYESFDLNQMNEGMDSLVDVYNAIFNGIVEEPPIALKEGGIIKSGYNEDIDNLRLAKTNGKQWLAELEASDRERTGIKNLKIKYNKVFGYYFEVTNSYQNLVPEDYVRKQTLANAERYTTPKLKELEDIILNAEDKLYALEYDAFCAIRDFILEYVPIIQKTAKALAKLDVYTSLSFVAQKNNYVRPTLNDKGSIDIKEGRHPVVEKMINHELFITNDTYLNNGKQAISVITGPNMAGKSTYMRQVALIVLMAQVGSFVPAKSANISIVDRIFTRVGASDDLASGQSTFMVEMNEVANILRNATPNSLLILDEIGRGTSTFDGLSIAWAVIEYISNKKLLGAKTLFATHYHELTELEGKMNNVNNYCIAVSEKGDDIVFLRKIMKGCADKSYGIQVAKLAGVPDLVIDRAKEIVSELSDNDIVLKVRSMDIDQKNKKPKHYDEVDLAQISLFDAVSNDDILEQLNQLDISNLTPLEAINVLNSLQSKVRNRWK